MDKYNYNKIDEAIIYISQVFINEEISIERKIMKVDEMIEERIKMAADRRYDAEPDILNMKLYRRDLRLQLILE